MKKNKVFLCTSIHSRHSIYTMTVCELPDVGVVLQTQQSMLWVAEDTLLDA